MLRRFQSRPQHRPQVVSSTADLLSSVQPPRAVHVPKRPSSCRSNEITEMKQSHPLPFADETSRILQQDLGSTDVNGTLRPIVAADTEPVGFAVSGEDEDLVVR